MYYILRTWAINMQYVWRSHRVKVHEKGKKGMAMMKGKNTSAGEAKKESIARSRTNRSGHLKTYKNALCSSRWRFKPG